ncbi:hypothetical protein PI124_g7725 [Phytophthora idaei]|nr:hypothetical protein PI125_g1002 [Phytophthora idaei]KAG3173376.1 hypothetical protein PI126_g897 [Phytophthora idaei]KAG3247603.1 hypothetical protein PI124_g7725 [Phytophthora idaei]
MPKPTTDVTWEVEVSEKTGRPIRWNGQNFQYYKKLMEIAARKKGADLYTIMKGDKTLEENPTTQQKSVWDAHQLDPARVDLLVCGHRHGPAAHGFGRRIGHVEVSL